MTSAVDLIMLKRKSTAGNICEQCGSDPTPRCLAVSHQTKLLEHHSRNKKATKFIFLNFVVRTAISIPL